MVVKIELFFDVIFQFQFSQPLAWKVRQVLFLIEVSLLTKPLLLSKNKTNNFFSKDVQLWVLLFSGVE